MLSTDIPTSRNWFSAVFSSCRTLQLIWMVAVISTCIGQDLIPQMQSTYPIEDCVRYSELLIRGKIALSQGDYSGAFEQLHEAASISAFTRSFDYLNLAGAAFASNRPMEARDKLVILVRSGVDRRFVESYSPFNGQAEEQSFEALFDSIYDSSSERCIGDFELYEIMNNHFIEDRTVRGMYSACEDKNLFLSEMGRQDSIRFHSLVKTIKVKGWPTFEKVGPISSLVPLILFHNIGFEDHTTPEDWDIVTTAIQREVDSGKESGWLLAKIEDLRRAREGKQQLYGTEKTGRPGDGGYHPIEDIGNVDRRRAIYCLPPLYLDAEYSGRELPEKYVYTRG